MMKKLMIVLCTILITAVSAGCNSDANTAADKGAETQAASSQLTAGMMAPAIDLTDTEGKTISLASLYQDKPVYVNFWATWCPPCVKEMPAVNAMHDKYGDKINFAAVSVDEQFADAKTFMTDRQLSVPLYTGDLQQLFQAYQINGIPVSLLIDKGGKIIFYQVGMMNEQQLEAFLQKAL
ncbi:MAG: TlpA family protein disulfide reductase [Megasphaera sp.]|jgi:thiol-disulfide isomerase/thioredoxin|nr:TlpA family protein disulfide reductase [Megasphaera sp.]